MNTETTNPSPDEIQFIPSPQEAQPIAKSTNQKSQGDSIDYHFKFERFNKTPFQIMDQLSSQKKLYMIIWLLVLIGVCCCSLCSTSTVSPKMLITMTNNTRPCNNIFFSNLI